MKQAFHTATYMIPTPTSAVLLGSSAPLRLIREHVVRLAGTLLPVLIEGEEGVGKKLVARAIHMNSPRSALKFVVVECSTETPFASIQGTLRDTLAEPRAPLTTGAILFDDIGALDPARQAALIGLLDSPLAAHVQILCTTKSDLEPKVKSGLFRDDLYYRINVAHVVVPPLRDRRGDIPVLATHFLHACASAYGRSVPDFSESMMRSLVAADWPGNVRQLEDAVKQYVLAGMQDSPRTDETSATNPALRKVTTEPLKALRRSALRDCEYKAILLSLERNYWNRRRTARELQVSYGYLLKLMRELGFPTKRTPHGDDSGI